jgi:outer membrane protein TolC
MILRIFTASLCLSLALPAQELLPIPSLASPIRYLKHHLEPQIESIQLQAPAKFEDYTINGKLELSLKSYLDLVLSNNTDMQINRMSIITSRNAIISAFGVFDPTLRLNFNNSRATQLSTNTRQDDSVTKTLNQSYPVTYNQTFQNGTQFQAAYSGSRFKTSSSTQILNPSFSSGLTFNVTQPLLRNRGGAITKLAITRARINYRGSELGLEDSIMRAVQTAEQAYWSVVEAKLSLEVQEKGLANTTFQLSRNEQELALGAISPLEIYGPQASKANAEISVTRARYTLQQQEDNLRRQIGADLDPRYRDMPILLTETTDAFDDGKPLDKEAYVNLALTKLPSLRRTRQNLDLDELTLMQAKNSLLPALNLTGNYGNSATDGWRYERATATSPLLLVSRGGYFGSLNNMLGFNAPSYGFGLSLTLPLRDRAASVGLANAIVTKKSNLLSLRSAEQAARLNTLNAVTNVEASRASLKGNQVSVDLAQKNFDAENQRYELGVSTIFVVTQTAQALTSAQANLVTAQIAVRRNMLNLLVQTGALLEERGIVIDTSK